ncbi:MAG: hypothetical protein JSW47_17095, partial [Phycisphaerales bacterium]
MFKRLSILFSFLLMLVLSTNVQAQPTGEILIEYWNNMGGTVLESDFYNQARFPDDPDDYEMLPAFDKPYDPPYGDNYGAQIRGYLYPPETGDYTFWIAADDDADLFLSTDDDPANKVKIAEINGWCPAYDFDNTGGTDNPNQVSAAVTLEAGVKYYIEGVYKEGGGGDGMATAWQGPGIPDRVIIDGAFLSPAPLAIVLLKAGSPIPADGEVDADVTALEWTAGATAVSHKVYLSTDATIDDADLVGETELLLQVAVLDPGVTYYWRVDEIEADGNLIEGNVWSFSTLPLEAHFPIPGDGAVNAIFDELIWTPGKDAIMHNVHFGTDPAVLLPVQMMSMETSYDAGALDPGTTYYWRVDEFTPAGTITGPVWSFSTPPVIPITDPNLVGWWKLDDGESLTALDSSGHGNHGTLRNNDGTLMTMTGTEWTTGILDGALFLEDGQYVDFGNDPSLQLTGEVTITAWVKMEPANEGVYMGIAGKLVHSPYNGYELVRHSSNVFRLWMGNDGGDLSSVSSDVTYTDTDWHHVVGVISNNTGYLYVDGVKQVEESAVGLVDTGDFAYIGKHYSNGSDRYWIGTIDDVRLYDYAISAEEIRLMGGDLTLAWSPDPANGAGDVPADTVLAWIPGDGAELQDVYLGTDADAVAAADIYDTTGIYRGRQAETAYIPDDLADGTTYYWRVDQVTVDGSTTCITTGPVWSFTTLIPIPITDPDMLIYYDFEFGEGSMAIDQSGHSNHGQFMGTPEWATGLFGGAVSIN